MSNAEDEQYIEETVTGLRDWAMQEIIQSKNMRGIPNDNAILNFVQADLWLRFNAEAKRKAAEEAAAAPPKKDGPRTTELL